VPPEPGPFDDGSSGFSAPQAMSTAWSATIVFRQLRVECPQDRFDLIRSGDYGGLTVAVQPGESKLRQH
jgi:hypothetical protein